MLTTHILRKMKRKEGKDNNRKRYSKKRRKHTKHLLKILLREVPVQQDTEKVTEKEEEINIHNQSQRRKVYGKRSKVYFQG
jgi:hypothetical protein